MSNYMGYGDDRVEDDGYSNGGAPDYDTHTGDPRLDLEHQRLYNEYKVPDEVRRFVLELRDFMADNNVYEMQRLYEERFPLLNQDYFSDQPWPDAEDILPYLGDDSANGMFMILYKELYYRHLYALPVPNLKPAHRFESYFNYCSLFNLILSTDQPIDLELPNQWLWDIIDEFIYQFQAFTQYRSRVGKKTAEEFDLLSENPTVWNVLNVLNVLHSLVDKSNINQQLEVYRSGGDPDCAAGEFGRHPLYKMLGYFSLIGLLRLHSLLGDYYQAIKVLENIELHKKSMHARVPACQITTFYYVGFAYVMMRRYADAIRTFSYILLYIQRTQQMFQVRGYQSDLMSKQNEQMFTLLAICLVLHPQSIDESVQTVLTEKYHEKMLKMSRGVREEFESAFTFACPKFLSPVVPDLESAAASSDLLREPQRQQLRVFMDEVEQQVFIDMVSRFGSVDVASELIGLAETAHEAASSADVAVSTLESAIAASASSEQICSARATVERAQMAANVAAERSCKARAAVGLDAGGADSLQLRDTSISTMRSYLRLYTTMPVHKMADFLGLDERRFRCYLLCFKHKMKNVVWSHGTSGLDGQFQSDSDIDFYIDDDMIHIADTKVAQRYGDFFIRQIHKLEELNHVIRAISA